MQKNFDNYLKQNDYEKYIRDGKYELTNKMTFEQIAKKLKSPKLKKRSTCRSASFLYNKHPKS
ncbi:hypothetical protein MCOL2_04681 [Listeria fleischmannii FSL S10-1203]|uniref:Uncharacterized protein n=1 Tax=Listeria fleischmannii FSL S10-1203 TaxID=1265822 RepID=W7DR03_9LIST|nr:hypothetical protein MCOL2_04681 [Listeria fleischmannii FSL S10-1203]